MDIILYGIIYNIRRVHNIIYARNNIILHPKCIISVAILSLRRQLPQTHSNGHESARTCRARIRRCGHAEGDLNNEGTATAKRRYRWRREQERA